MPVAPEHAGGGPTYFAWAGPGETTFGSGHIRYDEYILKLEIDLEEGKIPVATLDMINPGPAWWFASDRPGWAWIAFDTDGDVTAKFFGRILAVPSDLLGEIVTVKFYAKPLDYLARKQAAADALKVLPNYDKVFIDPAYVDDPDTVLEGYSANWHFDPVSHAITISDYIYGEAGEEEFAGSEIIYDSLSFTLGDPPPRAVKVDATVTYTQKASGAIDIGANAFSSLTGQGLYQGWPKPGASPGGGWTVLDSSADDGGVSNLTGAESKFEFKNHDEDHSNGDAMSVSESVSGWVAPGLATMVDYKASVSMTVGDPETGRAAALSVQESGVNVLSWNIKTTLQLGYAAARDRTEHLSFTLALDSQAMLSDDEGTSDIETLTFSGADVGQPLPGESTPPIGDVGRRSYFPTDRGLLSAAGRVAVARAHLLSKARPCEVGFSPISFSRALVLSCRHTARVHDSRRLPAGQASGKVVNVKITADGAGGQYLALVTIKGAIGHGGVSVVVEGTPTIVDADVMGPELQLFAGRKLVLDSADCLYSLPVDGVNDDGLVFPLTRDQVVVRSETLTSDGPSQEEVLARSSGLSGAGFGASDGRGVAIGAGLNDGSAFTGASQAQASTQTAVTALGAAQKWYELELKPVADLSFEYSFDIAAGPVLVPAQVALGG